MLEKYITKKEDGCIYREVSGETVILDRDGIWIHMLNEVGTEIWKLADGKTTVGEIVSRICEEFEVDRKVAEQDVLRFVEKLLKKNLIALCEKPV